MTSTAQLLAKRPRVSHDDTHNWRGGLLWMLVAVLALGMLDKWDDSHYWQKEAVRAQAEVDRRHAVESMPNPAIVLDAATAERYGLRLAEIAGGLDGERAKIRRMK